MGWDAYSSAFKNIDWKNEKLTDPKMNIIFRDAAESARKKAGSYDVLLRYGGLDVSHCGEMIEQATGEDCWPPEDDHEWDGQRVQQIASKANWDFEYSPDQACYYWSARVFLETCAKNNLSIKFYW